MGNTNVWQVSSAGAVRTERTEITHIVWTGSGSAGDQVTLNDKTGNRIWQGTAPGTANYIGITFGENTFVARGGLEVETLDSGVLYVYYRVP